MTSVEMRPSFPPLYIPYKSTIMCTFSPASTPRLHNNNVAIVIHCYVIRRSEADRQALRGERHASTASGSQALPIISSSRRQIPHTESGSLNIRTLMITLDFLASTHGHGVYLFPGSRVPSVPNHREPSVHTRFLESTGNIMEPSADPQASNPMIYY